MRVQMPFEARCAEVLAEAAAQRHVAFMIGNRDFLLGGGHAARPAARTPLPDPTLLRAWQQRRCC